MTCVHCACSHCCVWLLHGGGRGRVCGAPGDLHHLGHLSCHLPLVAHLLHSSAIPTRGREEQDLLQRRQKRLLCHCQPVLHCVLCMLCYLHRVGLQDQGLGLIQQWLQQWSVPPRGQRDLQIHWRQVEGPVGVYCNAILCVLKPVCHAVCISVKHALWCRTSAINTYICIYIADD